MRVDETYQDVGESVDNLERPGLKRLFRDMRAGKVDCVVVHTLDRLARNSLGLMMVAFRLHLDGVMLVTVSPVQYKGVFPKGKKHMFVGLMKQAGARSRK